MDDEGIAVTISRGKRREDTRAELVLCESCNRGHHGGPSPRLYVPPMWGRCGCACHLHADFFESTE